MHEQFLLAALDQAWLGRGICAPNPSVGAVAVHEGKIIAQSWHRGAGTLHAEQLLLEQLPKNSSEITLYVTLEPCNHWGKTPPCVDAIIKYGIKKVVYAYRDPNPVVVTNNTPRILNDHGIDVLHYPLPVIDDFYQSYRYWTLTKKPWVTVKMAQTMDGKIAGVGGEPVCISNALCSEFTHKKRLHSDVILTTARTINKDDPLLNIRLLGENIAKPVAIIDSRSGLNPAAKLFTTAKYCHIYHNDHPPTQEIHPNATRHAMPTTQGLLDLEAVINHLGSLGYHDVWVEAGGTLFSALHLARLVNRTYIYIAPTVLGSGAVAAYHHVDMLNQPCKVAWQAMGDNMIASLDWMTD
jgi:diaminohydroxyphosphoribosylaminopyrimidine deaminase/5-amino-6-(5-phosphoribosylamino)uracil reductase